MLVTVRSAKALNPSSSSDIVLISLEALPISVLQDIHSRYLEGHVL
jgi:hypothetical protein